MQCLKYYLKGMSYLELEDLTPKQLEFFTKYVFNGAGSDEIGIKGPEFIFHKAILLHDFLGFSCGTEQDRVDADNKFLQICIQTIKSTKKYQYYPIALLYYILLKLFSKYAWDYYPERSKTWKEFLYRVYVSTYAKESITKKITKRVLKRSIKHKEALKNTYIVAKDLDTPVI